ncbi:MAG: NACHT domain-containing protein [Flammeovirgaceae bacterium]
MPTQEEIEYKTQLINCVHKKLTGSSEIPVKMYHIKKLYDQLYSKFPQTAPGEESLRRIFGVGRKTQNVTPKEEYCDQFLWYLGDQYSDFAAFVHAKKSEESIRDEIPFAPSNQTYGVITQLNDYIINSQPDALPMLQALQRFIKKLIVDYTEQSCFNSIHLLGDKQNTVGGLSMAEDYIDVSYVKVSEMPCSELARERLNTVCVAKQRLFAAFGHESYLSSHLLVEHNRVIALGNPGVGKTTFARRLCHEWAKNSATLQGALPLYINLKKVKCSKSSNCIIDYIKRHFFQHVEVNHTFLFRLFAENPAHFIFILDGFDEAESAVRCCVLEAINELSYKSRFMLFTRPYALLNTTVEADVTIEVVGFNEANKERYIQAITAKQVDKTGDELQRLIETNPILANLANTPLMMAYISIVYLEVENLESILNSIDSVYKLQRTILKWVRDYYLSKHVEGYTSRQFAETLIRGAQLAYEMEMAHQYVYTDEGFLESRRELCESLSKMGIGRLEYSQIGEWRFSFNTQAIQAYLAAEQIGRTISPTRFMELLNNRSYWHLCRMIVGRLCVDKEELAIRKIWKALQNQTKKRASVYTEYCKLLFLSELERPVLNFIARESNLIQGYQYYQQYAGLNASWKGVLLEVASKIMPKLQSNLQQQWMHAMGGVGG